MGRYNIPKADSKELINEVQNSSSGDGGAKEYYYKIIGDRTKLQMLNLYTISSIIYFGGKVTASLNSFLNLGEVIVSSSVNDIAGFSIIGQPSYCIAESETDSVYIILNSLNFKDKIIELANKQGVPEEYLKSILDTIDATIQEITKEEYESMITYKP